MCTDAVGESERPSAGAAAGRGGGGRRGPDPTNPDGRYPSTGRGGSGADVGTGRSGAANFAGLVWLIWIVRHAGPSS